MLLLYFMKTCLWWPRCLLRTHNKGSDYLFFLKCCLLCFYLKYLQDVTPVLLSLFCSHTGKVRPLLLLGYLNTVLHNAFDNFFFFKLISEQISTSWMNIQNINILCSYQHEKKFQSTHQFFFYLALTKIKAKNISDCYCCSWYREPLLEPAHQHLEQMTGLRISLVLS